MTFIKTKIICTLGPSTADDDTLRELMRAGMHVARLNFSHGTHQSHGATMERVRRLREELDLPVAIMLDTKGPEVRVGAFETGEVALKKGQLFRLCAKSVPGTAQQVSVTWPSLAQDLRVGDAVLLDDGLIAMTVTKIEDGDILCRVENAGVISDHKSVNVPGTPLNIPFLRKQDVLDIRFGLQNHIDFIAASFTRCAEDILEIRKLLGREDGEDPKIIAKIENRQGVDNIDGILRVSDGIMIARGDLGVEIPLEDVPVIQKRLIRKGYSSGRPVITATQMLDSMMHNPRPTRAEATDVANAIYDGTSAIMLSGETAAGKYPVEAVKTMVRIAARTESDIDYVKRFSEREGRRIPDVTNAISHSAVTSAHDLGAAAIIAVTKSGHTARMISKYRPSCPIICCATDEGTRRQLNMSWGVIPLTMEEAYNTDELFERAVEAGEKAGLLHDGEVVVMTAGVPLGVSGTTNLMKVHVVGHILVTGSGISRSSVCAQLCVCQGEQDALDTFRDGDILVIRQTTNALLPQIRKASGLVLEDDDPNGHGAIAAMSLDLPVVIGAKNATKILKSGVVVTLDAERGVVSCNQTN
ncbi:MAG: pyruvate kinase [Clostridiales bacterium]|nr:pyruvate kinase [Clostridiales bacterium]